MDPDACLEQARKALNDYNQALLAGDRHAVLVAATTLADYFGALDEWLSRGGFLPEAWRTGESRP